MTGAIEDADDNMMVTDVNTQGAAFASGLPRALFGVHIGRTENAAQFQYDVAGDGQQFFMATEGGAFAAARPLTLVLNWRSGLAETR